MYICAYKHTEQKITLCFGCSRPISSSNTFNGDFIVIDHDIQSSYTLLADYSWRFVLWLCDSVNCKWTFCWQTIWGAVQVLLKCAHISPMKAKAFRLWFALIQRYTVGNTVLYLIVVAQFLNEWMIGVLQPFQHHRSYWARLPVKGNE